VSGYWLGLEGAVAGLLAGAVGQWALLGTAIRGEARRQGIPMTAEGATSEARVIYRFALPQALSGLSMVSAQWLAQAILARSAGYAQVGLFGAANTLRILVVFVPNILNNVSVSLLSHEKGRGDRRRYRKLFWTNLALTAGVALAAALGVLLFGPRLLGIFGKDFAEGRPVLNLLAVAGVCEALAVALHQVIVSREKIWLSFLLLWFPRDVLYLVLARQLAGPQQAVGLGLAWLCSWAFLLLALATVTAIIALGPERDAQPARLGN